jgi:hypothetical protein
MTKVTLHYDLSRPLREDEYTQIAQVHATFGVVRVRVEPGNKLYVDYDASRLTRKDVEHVLSSHGLPIAAAA